jgi:peptidyl-prolyl cis-trans isomerase C
MSYIIVNDFFKGGFTIVKNILLVLMVFLLMMVPVSFAVEDDPVIAEAGEYIIKKSDLERQISYLIPDKQKHLRENPQQKVTFIKRMLQLKVFSALARKEGLDKRVDVNERLQIIIDDFLTREYLDKVVVKDITVTDEDIEQFYKINKEKFFVPEQVKARHILVKVSPDATGDEKKKAVEKAEGVLERAGQGDDFAKLAEEYSDDPGSRQRGGALGFFGKGRMVKSFEDAAFSLKPGQISGIVETRFGFHIIKVEDHKEAHTRPLEEVRDIIKTQLHDDLARTRSAEFIKKTSEETGLKIYPERITGESK